MAEASGQSDPPTPDEEEKEALAKFTSFRNANVDS